MQAAHVTKTWQVLRDSSTLPVTEINRVHDTRAATWADVGMTWKQVALPGQVALLDVTTVSLLATWDEVVAVVELIVRVTEDSGIAWQGPLRVEAHTVEVGVVGTALHEGTTAHTLWCLCAVAQLGGQPGNTPHSVQKPQSRILVNKQPMTVTDQG